MSCSSKKKLKRTIQIIVELYEFFTGINTAKQNIFSTLAANFLGKIQKSVCLRSKLKTALSSKGLELEELKCHFQAIVKLNPVGLLG